MDHSLVDLFRISVTPAELIIRGTAVYWFFFLIFRFVLRRDVGSISIADVLLLVMISDAAQNAMAGDYRTVTDGFVLIGTLVGWNLLIDWGSFRFPRFRRFAAPPPLPLIRNGAVVASNLRREFITTDELMSQLRQQGIESIHEVKLAHVESDGAFSIIKRSPK